MNLRMGHIELFVHNPLAALPFYRDGLGAKLVDNQNDTFIWLKLGSQELLLRPGTPSKAALLYSQSQSAIVLYTDSLDTAVDHLREFGIICQPMPHEPECFTFQDSDGNWFQLVNPSGH